MPELPEVETIRRDLEEILRGRTLSRVEVLDRRAVEGFGPGGRARHRVSPDFFCAALRDRTIAAVERRGKYLLLRTTPPGVLLIHLRMTGQLIWGPSRPDARARFHCRGETQVLNYCDTRRFGELRWLAQESEDAGLAALGPEPFSSDFDPLSWGQGLRRSNAKIHALLLDQRRLAGLGNIYATEALFRSRLRPTRRGRRISTSEIGPLFRHIRGVLTEGLAHRGVSFRDYRDARGERGQAKDRLAVYGREGLPCVDCGSILIGVKISGRGTVYCPRCQQ